MKEQLDFHNQLQSLKKQSKKNTCPLCGNENIYCGAFIVECPNRECENFSDKQRKIVLEDFKRNLQKTILEKEERKKGPTTIPIVRV